MKKKKRFNTQQFFLFVFLQIHAVQKILPKMPAAAEEEGKVELFYLMIPKISSIKCSPVAEESKPGFIPLVLSFCQQISCH